MQFKYISNAVCLLDFITQQIGNLVREMKNIHKPENI